MAFIRPYKETDFEACANICIATLPPSLANASKEVARLSPYLWTHPYTYLSPSTCHILDDGAGAAVGYCIGCPDVHAFVAAYASYASSILSRDVSPPPPTPTPTPTLAAQREPWLISVDDDDDDDDDDGEEMDKGREKKTVNPAALAQLAWRADWMLLGGGGGDGDGENEEGKEDDGGVKEKGEEGKKEKEKKMGKAELTCRWRATMHVDLLEPWQGQGWGRKLIDAYVASVRASGADYGEGEHIGVAGENRKVLGFYERLGFRIVRDDGGEGSITLVRDIERP